MKLTSLILRVAAFAALLAAPAWADDPVTLQCTYTPNMSSLAGQEITMDFDLANGLIRVSTGDSHRIDQITDRYVFYGAGEIPQNSGSSWRLDRRTGVIEAQNIASHQFVPILDCRRVQGKVL